MLASNINCHDEHEEHESLKRMTLSYSEHTHHKKGVVCRHAFGEESLVSSECSCHSSDKSHQISGQTPSEENQPKVCCPVGAPGQQIELGI